MKIRILIFSIFFGILFASCNTDVPLKEFMVNSWETTYLKIEMNTVNKSDSLSVFEDKFDDNPKRVAQSKYNKDGTFNAWFKNREGERVSNSKGKWNVVNDTLFLEFNYGGRDMKVAYHITKTKEGFLGKSKYDWDKDGDYDDLLTMKTKRIKLK